MPILIHMAITEHKKWALIVAKSHRTSTYMYMIMHALYPHDAHCLNVMWVQCRFLIFLIIFTCVFLSCDVSVSVQDVEEELASVNLKDLPPKNNIRDENLTPKQLFLRYSGKQEIFVQCSELLVGLERNNYCIILSNVHRNNLAQWVKL